MTPHYALGVRYRAIVEGLTHYSSVSGCEFAHGACIEFVMIDEDGELAPEIVMVHFDESLSDPHGCYEREARQAFYEDWTAGRVQALATVRRRERACHRCGERDDAANLSVVDAVTLCGPCAALGVAG